MKRQLLLGITAMLLSACGAITPNFHAITMDTIMRVDGVVSVPCQPWSKQDGRLFGSADAESGTYCIAALEVSGEVAQDTPVRIADWVGGCGMGSCEVAKQRGFGSSRVVFSQLPSNLQHTDGLLLTVDQVPSAVLIKPGDRVGIRLETARNASGWYEPDTPRWATAIVLYKVGPQ